MTEGTSYCFECKRPLIEIDNRGQRLHGCMTCNIWWPLRGAEMVKLSVEDLQALQGEVRGTPKSSPGVLGAYAGAEVWKALTVAGQQP
jgi:hypothetical protein